MPSVTFKRFCKESEETTGRWRSGVSLKMNSWFANIKNIFRTFGRYKYAKPGEPHPVTMKRTQREGA